MAWPLIIRWARVYRRLDLFSMAAASANAPAVCGVGAQSCSFSRYEGEALARKTPNQKKEHDNGETGVH
jgi:hypothetical protein